MTRKICFVTGTRAEYGLLRVLMERIGEQRAFELQIIATGMHLSPEFGSTYREIEADGFKIDRKIEILLSADTATGIAKSVGLGLIGFGEAFAQLKPDVVVLLGDRFEIIAAAIAANVSRIPLVHLHGGERTEGAFDEGFRHAVTKMSHLHFVATEEYRRRVIQLGEQPERVFLVGGLGVDCIRKLALVDRAALESALGVKFGVRSLLITFHPVTLEDSTAAEQLRELFLALEGRRDTTLIFTMPNADTDGRVLIEMISGFTAEHPNAHAYTSLGQRLYLSCVRQVDGVIGNSSSGLTEVPSLLKGTINIGDRQRGRLRSSSVIDCAPTRRSIESALERLYSPEFQRNLTVARNPYGDGGASDRIVEILLNSQFDGLLKKEFYDLE